MYKHRGSGLSLLAVILSSVLIFCGCGDNGAARPQFHTGYFDLRKYMDDEADRLVKSNPLAEKTAYLDGKTEHHEMHFDRQQWQKEMAPFLDADINKPAFIQRYSTDTLTINDSTTCWVYKALDSKLRTRQLSLFFRKGASSPYKVDAELNTENIFYGSTQLLSYVSDSGYEIKGHQHIVLFGADTFAVVARF